MPAPPHPASSARRAMPLHEAIEQAPTLARLAAAAKSRRQKNRRSAATKRKMVEAKRHRAGIKENRRAGRE